MFLSNKLKMRIDLVGESAPLGFFDPLGFSKSATPAQLSKYRESELKHGRVAMVGERTCYLFFKRNLNISSTSLQFLVGSLKKSFILYMTAI
jgi:hypothetical protein